MEDDSNDYAWKIILWLILFLVFGIIIIACTGGPEKEIMTVRGPIGSDRLGTALTHEHVLVDFIGADSTGYFRWNRDSVIAKALPFILKAKEAGMNTLFECTPEFLGRDPVILKELSAMTGVNFITNTGWYGFSNKFLPESISSLDPHTLSEKWIGEFLNGIDGTGIRPGFIKIAVNPGDSLSDTDKKLISAAALTHLKTGLVIASHTGPEKPALAQIKVLKDMGVDPSAFIWVHAQRGTVESNMEAAGMGAWISLDNIRNRPNLRPEDKFSIDWYASRIAALKESGFLDRILISHDSGWYDPAVPGGGKYNGYTDLFEYLLPALEKRGFTKQDIDQMLVKNPAHAYTIKIRTNT